MELAFVPYRDRNIIFSLKMKTAMKGISGLYKAAFGQKLV